MTITFLRAHAAAIDDPGPAEAAGMTPPRRRFPSLIVASLLAAGVTVGASPASHAANCEDFTIILDNHTNYPVEIKITKFEYWDEDKWRTENIFGPIGYKRLYYWHHVEYKRNLQMIGSEYTQFRVTFKKDTDIDNPSVDWGDDIVITTESFVCHDLWGKTIDLM